MSREERSPIEISGDRGREYGMIMSLEIIPVLVRGYSRAPGGSRSVGRSPGLGDPEDWVVSVLLVR